MYPLNNFKSGQATPSPNLDYLSVLDGAFYMSNDREAAPRESEEVG